MVGKNSRRGIGEMEEGYKFIDLPGSNKILTSLGEGGKRPVREKGGKEKKKVSGCRC